MERSRLIIPNADLETGLAPGVTERQLASISPVSIMPFEIARKLVTIPENVKGSSWLDVGPGPSDVTARLLAMGADAYAIDPLYSLPGSEIRGKANHWLRSSGLKGDEALFRVEALKLFSDTFKADKVSRKDPYHDRYIASLINDRILPKNYFDKVISINCITYFLDIDRSIMMQAYYKCKNATKGGGEIQFVPFMGYNPDFDPQANDLRQANDKWFFNLLKEKSDVAEVTIIPTEADPKIFRLNILLDK